MPSPARFRRLAVGVLALNLPIILWGAYVRATFSGDGCGQHWPSCNGLLISLGASTKTLIEYTHRVTAGFSIIAAVVLVGAAWRSFPRGHPARRAAGAVAAFTVSEALLGAGLVLFRYVAHDEHAGRVGFMAAHLLNTFALLGAQVRTVQAADGAPLRLRGHGTAGALSMAAVAALALLGLTGAIAALGDTLYPAASLSEGWHSDFSSTSHLLVRLRIIHPFAALAAAALCASAAAGALRESRAAPHPALGLATLLAVQLTIGVLNLALLAPAGLQLLHLLVADLVWMAQIRLTGSILSGAPRPTHAVSDPIAHPAIKESHRCRSASV